MRLQKEYLPVERGRGRNAKMRERKRNERKQGVGRILVTEEANRVVGRDKYLHKRERRGDEVR